MTHKPTGSTPTFDQIELMKMVRFSIQATSWVIEKAVPEGRFRMLALRELDQVSLLACMGITFGAATEPPEESPAP